MDLKTQNRLDETHKLLISQLKYVLDVKKKNCAISLSTVNQLYDSISESFCDFQRNVVEDLCDDYKKTINKDSTKCQLYSLS